MCGRSLARIGMVMALMAATEAMAAGREFFVAPGGSDRKAGTREQPFASLRRARNAVRSVRKREGWPAGGVTVWVAGGTYEPGQGLELTAQDSGDPGGPVVYRAEPGATVRLVGGRPVPRWEAVSDPAIRARLAEAARGKVRQADLRALGISDLGALRSRGFARPVTPAHLELFCAGRPMTLARWPNEGFSQIAGIPAAAGQGDQHGGTIGDLQAGFLYEGDRPAKWASCEDVWVHGYWAWDWANSYERVESLDPATRLIKTAAPYGLYGFRQGQRLYFLNVLEELDSPGEYYLDRRSGVLYFWPPEGAAAKETWVSLLEAPLVDLREASHVVLRGFTLEYSRGTGVRISGGEENLVAGCVLRNLGNCGVVVKEGRGHRVVGCDLYHLGDAGITLSGGERKTLTPGGHQAVNNHVWDMARWSKCYQPGVGCEGVGQRVAHNLIHDGPHNGVLLGGNEHVIEYNEIHHVCLETGDVGAFYMGRDWTARGNVIRHNYFHETGGVGMGSMAVYLDDCASGTTIYGNLFWRCQRAAFVGGGRDNVVENNVFVECRPAVQIDGRGLDPSPVWQNMVYDTMKKRLEEMQWTQPPYSTKYPALADLAKYYAKDQGVPPEGNVVARNVCVGEWLSIGWHARPEMVTVKDNLVGPEPGFVDAARQDFRLREDSPAWKLGFERIPVEEIGLVRDEYREQIAATPE